MMALVVRTLMQPGLVLCALTAAALSARAEPRVARSEGGDAYELNVQSHTYLELYQRALLPGPSGEIVVTDSVAPLYQHVALRARALDLPFRRDSLDVELNAWGRLELAEPDGTQRLDGDLGAANVRYADEHLSLKLGRQHFAGGAARYVRFDGASGGARHASGLGVEAYAGFSVPLPAYRRRGYLLLGATPDSLVRNQDTYSGDDRGSSWLGGVRAFYERPSSHGASISFHEERRSGRLERRNLGVDAHAGVTKSADLAASAVLDIDAERFADVRAFADFFATEELDVGAEYLHAEPALLLSRQSVFSVFSSDQLDELGARATLRVVRDIELGGSAHFDRYDDGDVGSRAEVRTRFRPEGDGRLIVSLAYARVLAPENGYHSARLALRQRLLRALTASAEAHYYVYDRNILGYSSSSITAGTLEYLLQSDLALLWGASLARSPYARLDAQTVVRLSYELSLGEGRDR